MDKHFAYPAWDEGFEYMGFIPEQYAPVSAIECTAPTEPGRTGYIRFNATTQEWYWPQSAVLRFERVWRQEQWPAADDGKRLVEDDNVKKVGTLQDWKDHKNALRDWPDHPLISVESELRPVKPTA